VRWSSRYALSYRDVEELLAERGIEVDHVRVYRWVRRFTPLLVDAARPCRHDPGDRWFVFATVPKVPEGTVSPLCCMMKAPAGLMQQYPPVHF
jgi:IS6 family transposase